jgi:hypothetical protein
VTALFDEDAMEMDVSAMLQDVVAAIDSSGVHHYPLALSGHAARDTPAKHLRFGLRRKRWP